MCGRKEWSGSTHCTFPWQSFPPDQRVGGAGRVPCPSAGQDQEQCPWGSGKAVSLGSSSSRDHQLGLALRSRWDMEIPVCP